MPEKNASGKINYTTESGSLVLKLQPAFLETLSIGDHKIKALFKDGSGSATFTVKATSSREDGSSATKTSAAKSSLAKTGDALPLTVVIMAAALAALALAVLLIARHKRE